jgi:hypothetical protein
MSKLLDQAIAKARELPPDQQDAIASVVLREIEGAAACDRRFAASPALFGELADAALSEAATGKVGEDDPCTRP